MTSRYKISTDIVPKSSDVCLGSTIDTAAEDDLIGPSTLAWHTRGKASTAT